MSPWHEEPLSEILAAHRERQRAEGAESYYQASLWTDVCPSCGAYTALGEVRRRSDDQLLRRLCMDCWLGEDL